MRVALIVTLLVLAFGIVPVSAQTRFTDRVMATAAIGPNFGSDVTGTSTIGMVGLKLNNWASVGAELGAVSQKPFNSDDTKKTVLGRYVNGAVRLDYPYFKKIVPYVTAGMGGYHLTSNGTHFDTNLGVGVSYPLSRWFGISAENRTYFVGTDLPSEGMKPLNRFTIGVSVSTK
jgi:hypothetical protein